MLVRVWRRLRRRNAFHFANDVVAITTGPDGALPSKRGPLGRAFRQKMSVRTDVSVTEMRDTYGITEGAFVATANGNVTLTLDDEEGASLPALDDKATP